jgi:hypothetical protein
MSCRAQGLWLVAASLLAAWLTLGSRALAQEISLEPATPAVDPAAEVPLLKWEARVMPGFELERERPSEEQGGDAQTDYGFFLDQARLSLEVEWKDLSLEVSADLADAIRPRTSSAAFNKPPYLRNAYVSYRVHKAFRVRAGRFKRPFSALERTSSGDLPFRGRGLSNELILEDGQWGDRALGLMFHGRLPGKLRWYLSATNPSWAPDGDLESNGVDAIARLEWEVAGIVELGASFGHKLEVRAEREYNGNAASFDAALNVAGLRVALDAVLGELTTQETMEVEAPTAYGLVGYATYQIPIGGDFALEPVLLGEYADADSEFSRTEAVRAIIGCNFRVADHLRVMPQVEIVRPIGTAATVNPWSSGETYYLMMTAQL